ncbi:hypothetical protein K2Y11_19355 [bacterium]|nr:hypothetical protein [bacterium]
MKWCVTSGWCSWAVLIGWSFASTDTALGATFNSTSDTRVYISDSSQVTYTTQLGNTNLAITNQSGQTLTLGHTPRISSTGHHPPTSISAPEGWFLRSASVGTPFAQMSGPDNVRFDGSSNVVGSDGRLDGGSFNATTLGLSSASLSFITEGNRSSGTGWALPRISGPIVVDVAASYTITEIYRVTGTVSDSPITNISEIVSSTSNPMGMTDRSELGDFDAPIELNQELLLGAAVRLVFRNPSNGTFLGEKTYSVSLPQLAGSATVTTDLDGTLAVEEQFLPLGSPYVDALLKVDGTLPSLAPVVFPYSYAGTLTLTNEVVNLGAFGDITLNGSMEISRSGQVTSQLTDFSLVGAGPGVLNLTGVPEVSSMALMGTALGGFALLYLRRWKFCDPVSLANVVHHR